MLPNLGVVPLHLHGFLLDPEISDDAEPALDEVAGALRRAFG